MPDETEVIENETRRASIAPAGQVSEAELNRLLALINERQAREPLTLDQVYIFPGEISNQRIDFYGTRMAESSLTNYVNQVKAGLPLLNSHRSGGWDPTELPIGRMFDGALEGTPLQVGQASFDQQAGQRLAVWHYIPRDVKVSLEVSNNDLITGIRAGTIRDESIGFTIRPDGQFTCSICGRDYLNRGVRDPEDLCRHLAFATYDGQRAFVWVEHASLLEASLVYHGATPGAMIRKAQAFAGDLDPAGLEILEEHYQVRLLDRSVNPVAKPNPKRKEDNHMSINRTPILAILEADVEADNLAKFRSAESDDEFALGAITAMHDVLAAEQSERQSLADQAETLEAEAEMGRTYRDDLVDGAVKARVRVQGNEFDAERYRNALVAAGDLEWVKSERVFWEGRAAEIFQAGPGQSRQAGDEDEDEEPHRAPAGAYQ